VAGPLASTPTDSFPGTGGGVVDAYSAHKGGGGEGVRIAKMGKTLILKHIKTLITNNAAKKSCKLHMM